MVACCEESDVNYGSINEGLDYLGNDITSLESKTVDVANGGDGKTCTLHNSPYDSLLRDNNKELLNDEIAGMTKLAIPVIVTYILEMFPKIVQVALVGRVGHDGVQYLDTSDDDAADGGLISMQKIHLDAASLALMFTNIVVMSPAIGLLSAMDTLCSQAHGASQPRRLGTYFLTSLAVLSFVLLIGCVLIRSATSILISLGQPIEVSRLAEQFLIYTLPGIPFIYLYELIRKVFQARNEAVPMLIAAVACNVVNAFLGYYLVQYTDWGWIGAALAGSVANAVLVPIALMSMVVGLGGNREKDFNLEFLHRIWEGFVINEALSATAIIEFLSLGIPGMLQVMFEWCAFEAVALLCGILPGNEAIIGIGANTIIMTVSSMAYMPYLGVSIAGNVRIGNALGAGDAHRAATASKLTLAVSSIMAIVNVGLILSFRKSLPWLFTTDRDIAQKAQRVLLVVAAFQLPDAVNGAVQGILRGSGRQTLGAKVNFVAYYIIGIPLGYILGIRLGIGVEGLWMGMTAGLCFISSGCTITILRSDWQKLALDAKSRLGR